MSFVFNPFTGNFDAAGQTTVNNTGVITIQPSGNTAGATAAISSGSVVLAGGNNITLSQNGSTISIVGGAGGGGGSINLSAGTTSNNLTNFVLSNSNGLAFGLNGSTITGSYTVPTQTQYVFSNSNGVSFGTNGSTVTATVRTDYQSAGAYLTTARASNDAIGLNTAFTNVTATANSSGLSINAAGYAGTGTTGTNATFTLNSNGLQLNAGAYLTTAMASNRGSDFVQANAAFAGTNASGTIASNGISISVAAGGGAGDGYNILGVNGAGTSASTTLQLSNANNVSFGLNAGTITASASYSQSTQPVAASASNGSFNFSTLKFVEGSGVTWATQVNGIQASVKTDYQSSNANYLTSQSNQALSGSNGSFAFQTATFGSSNGMHFYTTNGSLVGSYTVPTQSVQPVAASASNGSFNFSTLNFSNANNVTFGTSAGGIVTASVAAPGAAAENNWFNLLGANTAGNTTASGSTIGLSGINLTLSGTNGSVINVSGPARFTVSGYDPYADLEMVTIATSQGTMTIDPEYLPNVQFDRVLFPLNNTNSSNSSGSHSLTFRVGIYTQNASTLSLLTSGSISTALTHSGTAGSYSLYSGWRLMSIPLTTTLTEGKYWLAFLSSTASANTNGSYSLMGVSQQASNFLGFFGSSHNTTYQFTLGQGIYTAATNGMPTSVAFSHIRGSDSQGFRAPYLMLVSSTI